MKLLILASQSPRRKELLERAGFEFQALPIEVSEILEKNLTLEDALMALAEKKAKACVESGKLAKFQEYLVLAGDTVVVLENEVLGKPSSTQQAVEFLNKLSDKTHRVITAVCLVDEVGLVARDFAETKIKFRKLSAIEIEEYVQSGEPMDKAGAYGIQGLASKFVEKMEGPYDNVVGLPVEVVQRLIQENGWHVSKRTN